MPDRLAFVLVMGFMLWPAFALAWCIGTAIRWLIDRTKS